MAADPVPAQLVDHAVPEALRVLAYRAGNLVKVPPRPRVADSLEKALPGAVDKVPRLAAYLPDPVGARGVGVVALVDDPRVEADDVALLEVPPLARDAVHDLVVYGNAD